jgi:drug/metabolite transporter (DMT)-like permease
MRRGPLNMIAASLMFTLMVAAVKVAREEMSALDLVFYRSLFALPLAAAFAWPSRFRIEDKKGIVWRASLGFAAMVMTFTAAGGLTVADLTIIGKLQPLLIAIIAPLVLGRGERPSPALWIVLAVGLTGSALIIGPDLQVGSFYALIALGSALLSAGAHTAVRGLARTDDPASVAFWFQAMLLPMSIVACLAVEGGLPPLPSVELLPWLVACGVTSTIGQFLMTRAYTFDTAPSVAASTYVSPLFAMAIDLVMFAGPPAPHVIAGAALVVGAGLYLVFRSPPVTSAASCEGR